MTKYGRWGVGWSLFLLFVIPPVVASPVDTDARSILSFVEHDQDGHDRALTTTQPIDINSRITIRIDRESLRARPVSLGTGEAIDAAIKRADALGKVAVKGQESLAPRAAALATWALTPNRADPATIKRLEQALAPTAAAALEIIHAAPAGSTLRQRLTVALSTAPGVAEQYRAVFDVAQTEAQALRASVDGLARGAGSYYVLGAWMVTAAGTSPIHIPGFDNYPPGERVEIERWVIALTEAQKQQLRQLETNARSINNGSAGILEDVKANAATALRNFAESAIPCLTAVAAKIDALLAIGGEDIGSVRDEAEKAKSAIDTYREHLAALRAKYEGTPATETSAAEFLIGTNEDLVDVVQRTREIVGMLEGLAGLPNRVQNAASRLRNALRETAQAVEGCQGILKANASASGSISDLINGALKGRTIAADLLEFAESLQHFDLESLPAEATVSLLYAGRRAAGDTLMIKLGVGQGEKKPEDLESEEFQVLRLLPHIDTVIVLIFAHPQGESELESHFQAAPSYSVLFKPRCKTAVCRKLWDFGVGLNVAALDFNHDDVPELGVGGVVSLVRDYVEGGFGLNVPRKQWYGFFGLRLPLPAFTLPAAGSGEHGQQ